MSVVVTADESGVAARAADVLRAGKLVVLPADGVYGVAADAFRPEATRALRAAKRSTRRTPFAVLIRSPRQTTGLVEALPETAERLMAAYWPGPLTIVLRAVDDLPWDLGETRGTVALRMPTDALLLDVIRDIGPMAVSAATRRGSPPPTDVEAARGQLGETVELYVDGGPRDGAVSTIVDVSGEQVRVLRAGAVGEAHVRAVAAGETEWGQPATGGGGTAEGEPSAAAPGDASGADERVQ